MAAASALAVGPLAVAVSPRVPVLAAGGGGSGAGSGVVSPMAAAGGSGLPSSGSPSSGGSGSAALSPVAGAGAGTGAGAGAGAGLPSEPPGKLFVGQVPNTVWEDVLRPVFEPYGRVLELTVLKDKATNAHRGAAFVTYARRSDAERARQALDGKTQFPNSNKKALAVSFAANRGDPTPVAAPVSVLAATPSAMPPAMTEFKLYVGMLHRSTTEEEVRKMFEPYGVLKEVYLMTQDGKSKGTAFVKYSRRDEAERAVLALNERVRDKEAPGVLQVRFAHTKAEKQALQHTAGAAAATSPVAAAHTAIPAQVLGIPRIPGQLWTVNAAGQLVPANTALLSQPLMSAAHVPQPQPQPQPQSLYATDHHAAAAHVHAPHQHQHHPQHLHAAHHPHALHHAPVALTNDSVAAAAVAAAAAGAGAGWGMPNLLGGMSFAQPQPQPQPHYAAAPAPAPLANLQYAPSLVQPNGAALVQPPHPQVAAAAAVGQANKDARGPAGANLFIYNLPLSFGDADLQGLFATFGTVLSSHVQRDRQTGASKGFGFVSFEQPTAADAAIQALDGFVVGTRKLSVRIKGAGPASGRPY